MVLILSLFTLYFLSRVANPHFSLYSPIYSLRWVEALWLLPDLIRVDGGPIPSFLSGCSVGNDGNGIGTDSHLQKATRQRYSPSQYRATKSNIRLLRTQAVLGKHIPNRTIIDQLSLVSRYVQGRMDLLRYLNSVGSLRCSRPKNKGPTGVGPHIIL